MVTATTANTKTGWNLIGATQTNFDYEQICVYMGWATTPNFANFVVDIGVSTSTATGFYVLAENLRLEQGLFTNEAQSVYYLPLHVPKGSQLGTRISCSVASGSMSITVVGSSRGIRGVPGYARCFAIGTATSSRGITLLATTGGPSTVGAYSVLTTNCPRRADAIFAHLGINGDTSKAAAMTWLLDIAAGTATDAVYDVLQDLFFETETILDKPMICISPIFPIDIAAGYAVQARMQTTSTATADSAVDLLLYGLEP